MADEAAPVESGQETAAPVEGGDGGEEQQPTLLAGKYADEAALSQGITELRKAAKLESFEEGKPVIGEKGVYPNASVAERAYLDLQSMHSRLTRKPAAEPSQPGTLSEPAAPPDPSTDTVEAVLGKAGIDGAAIGAEYVKEGKLSDANYAALQKLGYTPAMVNNYLAGQVAIQQSQMAARAEIDDAMIEQVGGKEQFDNLATFYKSLPVEKQRIIYSLTHGADASKDSAVTGIETLMGWHAKAIGAGSGAHVGGEGAAGGGGKTEGFTSKGERDAAYKKAVETHGKGRAYDDPEFARRMAATDVRLMR